MQGPSRKNYKVLIPTDFSEHSRIAVNYVLHAFRDHLTHLYLLHAYRDHAPDVAPMISLVDILREKSERMMLVEEKYVATLGHSEDLVVVAMSRFDRLLEAICDVTEAEDIDLVVISSSGRTHPRLDMREEDPAYLLHKVNRPILLVPKLLN